MGELARGPALSEIADCFYSLMALIQVSSKDLSPRANGNGWLL